jgi:uncharacterized protein (TIGR00369 family)
MTETPVRYRTIPFLEHLGARIVALDEQGVQIELEVRPELCNSGNVAHGGVLMAVLDAALSVAGRSAHTTDPDAPQRSVTIEMKTTFLRPATGRLRAIGRCVHRTGSLMFCEGEVLDAEDRTVARASGTFKLRVLRDGRIGPPAED